MKVVALCPELTPTLVARSSPAPSVIARVAIVATDASSIAQRTLLNRAVLNQVSVMRASLKILGRSLL